MMPLLSDLGWLKRLWLATILALLSGFGFFAIPLGSFYVTPGRAALALFLYLLILTFLVQHGGISVRLKVVRYLLFLALWVSWIVISLFWAPVTVNTGRHLEAIILGTVVIVVSLSFLSSEGGIRSLHRLWIISTLLFLGIGAWEMVTGTHLGFVQEARWVDPAQGHFATAVFFGPNVFSTFLALSFPFLYTLSTFSGSMLAKAVGLIAILFSLYIIFMNGARAGIVSVLIGVSVLFLLMAWRDKLKFMAVILVAGGVIILAVYALRLTQGFALIGWVQEVPREIASLWNEPSSIASRTSLVKNGLVFLQDSHFVGIGPGAFEYYMEQTFLFFDTEGAINPHNWWLEILVDYGVLIFGLFLAFYIGLLWNVFRVFRSTANQTLRMVALATLVSLAEFSVASMGPSGVIREYFVWLLFATALCVINLHRIQRKAGS